MAKLTRRQLLLTGLGVGVVVSGIDELRRRRALHAEQATLTDLLLGNQEYVDAAVNTAIAGDTEATAATNRILANLKLKPPSEPYNREVSKTLIQCSRLATEQYLTGKFDLSFDGSIQALPSYDDRLQNYEQVAVIKGPEEIGATNTVAVSPELTVGDMAIALDDPLHESANQVKDLVRQLAGQTVAIQWSFPVYWGFVLTSPRHHILVLRGTQRTYEWLQTVRAQQVTKRKVSEFDFAGAIHHGFANIYAKLSQATLAALESLTPDRPLFVSGHSLGAPLSTLAALDIAQRVPALADQLRLYTYAGPRVGNPEFAEAHSQLIPNSYRIANLADLVPLLPPVKISDSVYVHLGEPWGFTASTGDIGSQHYVSAYRAAIDAEQEKVVGEADAT
ncbi:MAG: lipase family protein [Spirulinaceae cyanobacterium RM2_2_10]|nr:lipase family protein [Spirulinaceae cyanobacterium SM2_1_0]NJO19596.1 lipase family protein [Spirulinaceae cyanobacterium RM2_2_10]